MAQLLFENIDQGRTERSLSREAMQLEGSAGQQRRRINLSSVALMVPSVPVKDRGTVETA